MLASKRKIFQTVKEGFGLAQSAQCLPYKHKDLGLMLGSTLKNKNKKRKSKFHDTLLILAQRRQISGSLGLQANSRPVRDPV